MSDDNILPFPNKFRDTLDDVQWQKLQGEFYLDCYQAEHGHAAENPEQLKLWLQSSKLFADMDNPFFRGWLLRRLAESPE